MSKQDKIKGMICGHAFGDSLGLPSEFRPIQSYTKKLIANTQLSRYYGNRNCVLGQVSDDTEMAMALIYSLCKDDKLSYNRNEAIKEYISWANSDCPFMGNNTRKLFKKITTVNGYTKRFEKLSEQSESNGCMMRCYPFSLLSGNEHLVDCSLTNDTQICLDIVDIYTKSLRDALSGLCRKSIYDNAVINSSKKESSKILINLLNYAKSPSHDIDITVNRGWILHAFYTTYWGLYNFDNYRDTIDNIILHSVKGKKTGDTDTNAAIAGALCGALYGFDKIISDTQTREEMGIILNANPNDGEIKRPAKYHFNRDNLDFFMRKLSD